VGASTAALLQEKTAGLLPENTPALLPEDTAALLRENTAAELRENTMALLPETTPAQLPEDTPALLPETTAALLQEKPAALLQEKTAALLPEDTAALLPETTTAQLPEDTPALLPETTAALLQEKTAALLQEKTAALLPGTTTAQLPEDTPALLPETTADLLSEDTPALLPENTAALAPLEPAAGLLPPPPPGPPPGSHSRDDEFPGEVEMPLLDHLEELRRRILRSLLALVVAAAACLVFVRPLVRLLEMPAQGIRFLQLAPGEFLFVSLKVAGYAGLTLALPWMLFEALAFVLPGLTRRERRLVAPTLAGSSLLFAAGLAFAWWALVPAALRFLVSYGADVVEPIWSIERYLDFVLLLMVATALAFQLPVLQLLLGALGLVNARRMLSAWRWVVLASALAGAVLTPSTDPITMLLLSGAIIGLYLIGIGLVVLSRGWGAQAAAE
jgi:sec-independent protein translocase protein TatC